MKNRILIFALAAAVLAGGFTVTKIFAAENAAPARGKILQRIADKLNLSAAQRTQIRSILLDESDNLKQLFGQLHDARTNLREVIRASDTNEAAVRAAAAEVAGVEADLAVERLKLYRQIAPVLTNEQRGKIAAFEQRIDGVVDNAIAQLGAGPGN
jgi:Spy/CpxP family protein refolding chaperone